MEEEEEDPTKLCFVVGPIGAEDSSDRVHSDWLLEMIIQPVMAGFSEFETKRADQITTPGMIDVQVINALLTADLVIADMSTRNPNAFYEIGIRHMAQKPIIHMQLTDENIPFDVSLYRAIKYSRARPRDLRKAQEALRAQVTAVTAENYQVDNPITRTRGVVALQQQATSGEKVMLDEWRDIRSRVMQLEKGRGARAQHDLYYEISSAIPPSGRMPVGTTLVTFISAAGLTEAHVVAIQKSMSKQFRLWTMIAKTSTELTVAVPGEININDIEIPSGAPPDLEIVPMRPFKDPGHF
jgi:hypothetical protein